MRRVELPSAPEVAGDYFQQKAVALFYVFFLGGGTVFPTGNQLFDCSFGLAGGRNKHGPCLVVWRGFERLVLAGGEGLQCHLHIERAGLIQRRPLESTMFLRKGESPNLISAVFLDEVEVDMEQPRKARMFSLVPLALGEQNGTPWLTHADPQTLKLLDSGQGTRSLTTQLRVSLVPSRYPKKQIKYGT